MNYNKKYYIMNRKAVKDNYNSYYQFVTEQSGNEYHMVGFNTESELDTYIKDLLNNKGFSKDDFIIVSIKDYSITTNYNIN